MSSARISLFVVIILLLGLVACVPANISTPTPVSSTETPTRANPPTPTRLVLHPLPSPLPSSTGTLVVEIVYSGQWYRETFNYQPDAANIRHVALVMPVDSVIQLKGAGWAFSNLKFTPYPAPLAMREEAVEFIPILDFMHDAPGGVVSIDLPPGKYNVAVAFIAAALPPPGGDVILYPGVTGGGASNEFQVVEIAAGRTVYFSVELTDENGWGWLPELASR